MLRTVVVHGRYAAAQERIRLARKSASGVTVTDFEGLAAKLAGGFACPVSGSDLRAAIIEAIPNVDMAELESIKTLPGVPAAACETLHRAWRAGINLQERRDENARMKSMANLEAAVLPLLPPGAMRPADLAAKARARIGHAAAVLGEVRIQGLTELSPVWHELLFDLAKSVTVIWEAGPREVPDWVQGKGIEIRTGGGHSPDVSYFSAANPAHEAVEAMRWCRELVASGTAKPEEVAIAAASTGEYDEHFLAFRRGSNIPLGFAHGIPALGTRPGQAAAALADVLLRGLSQDRVRRLNALSDKKGLFGSLPENWTRVLSAELPLTSLNSWQITVARIAPSDWPDGVDHNADLLAAVTLLAGGTASAQAAGDAFLSGRAREIWKRALREGPAAAVEATLGKARVDDEFSPHAAVAWMPAYALAANPRPFVRLLGLSSRGWPRRSGSDLLLPDHIIPSDEIEPLPVDVADRRDFATIMLTTERRVSVSRPRRGSDGRILGRSSLVAGVAENYLERNRTPEHAYSEADRHFARPSDFRALPTSILANECWTDWNDKTRLTPHDGLMPNGHPRLQIMMQREHSATSLKLLLRDPIGYVWRYGLKASEPRSGTEPLTLDNREFGSLTHEILDGAVKSFHGKGLAGVSDADLRKAVSDSLATVAADWAAKHPIPPQTVWDGTLKEAEALSVLVLEKLRDRHAANPGLESYSEACFGDPKNPTLGPLPWPLPAKVVIGGQEIGGIIDRLDIDPARTKAWVNDYKFGEPIGRAKQLDGGDELQRTIYACAVRAAFPGVDVTASLLYPREGCLDLPLADTVKSLADLDEAIKEAVKAFAAGKTVAGPGSTSQYNDLRLALPANVEQGYWRDKKANIEGLLDEAAKIWEVE